MSEEIFQAVAELKEFSDFLYKGFKITSSFLEDVQMTKKINPLPNSRLSIESYARSFVSEFILKKIFGEYSK